MRPPIATAIVVDGAAAPATHTYGAAAPATHTYVTGSAFEAIDLRRRTAPRLIARARRQ